MYSDQITVESKAHLECNFFPLSGVMHIAPYGNSKKIAQLRRLGKINDALLVKREPTHRNKCDAARNFIHRPYGLLWRCIGILCVHYFYFFPTHHSAYKL